MDTISELEPVCRDEQRRADLLAHPLLNGIDFVEYQHRPAALLPFVLVVHFLKALPDAPHSDPDGAYDLTNHPEWVSITGGARIVDIAVLNVVLVGSTLEIAVDKAGDFSTYWLSLGWVREPDGQMLHVIANLDQRFSLAPIDFKAECPSEFDCAPQEYCPPETLDEPLLNYLAKDYSSFRQLMLDLIAQRNPDWLERNPADLGMAMVELLAYTGDHLSYYQDAVANEAYLDTARQRVSAKRHARLIDYRMHDGRNAWTAVHVRVTSSGTVPISTKLLSRIADPLRNDTRAPPVVIAEADLPESAYTSDPALLRSRVFETSFELAVEPAHNTLYLHPWGNRECCLAPGTTSVHLYATDPGDANRAVRPLLVSGDYLLLEEIIGAETGLSADADPAHRQVVRITSVADAEDGVYSDTLNNGIVQVRSAAESALPLLHVRWSRDDALNFPLCLSALTRDDDFLNNVSVGRGNMVLADDGRTVMEDLPQAPAVATNDRVRLRLTQGPLTLQRQPNDMRYFEDPIRGAVPITARHDLHGAADDAAPAVAVIATQPTTDELWTAVADLMDSPRFATHFIADVGNDGRAELRFGDGQYGKEPVGVSKFRVTYRIGNGRDGNIGAEALAHAVRPHVAPAWPSIEAIRNPLAALGGQDAQVIDEVRQWAPAAFRAEQFRAVTEDDYRQAALKLESVAGAVAAFRWTGSWHTVLLAIDPRDPRDLITLPGRRTRLQADFAATVKAHIERYRLAGYDLEIRSAEYVPLEIDMQICVLPGYFRGDVLEAVHWALSNRINPDGSKGLFHPDKFSFGDDVYLSRIYAAVEAVQGVDSATVQRFRILDELDNGELDQGFIPIDAWQIARLDNDRNFQENGVLRLSVGGGK